MFINPHSNMNRSQQVHSDAIQSRRGNLALWSNERPHESADWLGAENGVVMAKISKRLAVRLAALGGLTIGLSGCVYGDGLGYYDDGYYDCDPYSQFDSYYACDNGYGFYNIGFGGGWYDSYWYPGYGFYVFDNFGRRYTMRDHDRRYWGGRRQDWYRDNRGGRDGHHGNYGGGRSGYRDGGPNQPIAWPERNGGRLDDRPGRPPSATPPPGAAPEGWRDGRGRGDRDGRGDGRGEGRGGWRGDRGPQVDNGGQAVLPPQPRADNPGRGNSGRGQWQPPVDNGQGRGQGNSGGYRAPPPPPPQQQQEAPPPAAPRMPPRPTRETPDRQPD
jgi:hypothetical protein